MKMTNQDRERLRKKWQNNNAIRPIPPPTMEIENELYELHSIPIPEYKNDVIAGIIFCVIIILSVLGGSAT